MVIVINAFTCVVVQFYNSDSETILHTKFMIGMSLSKPHTSLIALHTHVCIYGTWTITILVNQEEEVLGSTS